MKRSTGTTTSANGSSSNEATEEVVSFSNTVQQTKIHLIPFFISLTVYILIFIPMEYQTLTGMVLKCLPIVCLQYFVYAYNNASRQLGFHDEMTSYRTKILFGLIFASFGDAFLDFPGYFLQGTIAFAVAQVFNIWAFGLQPLNPILGLTVYGVLSLPLFLIRETLKLQDKTFIIAASIYALLLKTMVWRAISRCRLEQNREQRDWGRKFGCLGAISFGLSDATLAINKFCTPVPYAQAIIMLTYYLAQLGIALSVTSAARFGVFEQGGETSSRPKSRRTKNPR